MLPKAGVFAHKHAETVAQEIAARIKGSEAPKPYDGLGYCFIEIGDGTAGFAKGNFYAEPDPTIKASKPGKLLLRAQKGTRPAGARPFLFTNISPAARLFRQLSRLISTMRTSDSIDISAAAT